MNKEISKKSVLRKFNLTLGLIGILTGGFYIHQYMSKNHAEKARKFYFDKLFDNNLNWKERGTKEQNINLYYMLQMYRTLLKFNCIPGTKLDLTDNNVELSTNLLGLKFNHPVGLGPGVDISGNMISNLNRLGFEFIEVGPIVDEAEMTADSKSKTEFHPIEKHSILMKNMENLNSFSHSISLIQSEIFKLLKEPNKKNLYISTDLKLSNKSSKSVPYMADTFFINMLKQALLLSDFVTINLSSYSHFAILQYKNFEKFENLLNKIRDEVYYDMGVKSVFEYEMKSEKEENNSKPGFKITDSMIYPVHLFKKSRVRLLLRLDTDFKNTESDLNYLKGVVDIVKRNGIIDGFVIGGLTKAEGVSNFYSGEKSKEVSLEMLKVMFSITKGEIPIISTGGVLTGEDVYERLKLGANFVLIYSPFLLRGPYCLEGILTELKQKMKGDGKKAIPEIKI